MNTPTLIIAVERVTLVDPDQPMFSQSGWLGLVAFAMLCIVAGGAISVHAWRDRRLATPEERAFRVLSRAMGLVAGERTILRSLARKSGVAEVALVLSRGAFDHAAPAGGPSDLQELRRRLFSDRSS